MGHQVIIPMNGLPLCYHYPIQNVHPPQLARPQKRVREEAFNLIFLTRFYRVFIIQCLLKISSVIAWDLVAIGSSVATRWKRQLIFIGL